MKPTEKQKIALDLLTEHETSFVGYGGSAGGGKSYLGCYWLMQMCFYAPETRWFIGRDSLKDTRASVLRSWSKLAKEIGFTQWKFGNDSIIFDNGSEIELLDLSFYPHKDPMFERFGSKEYTGGWIEEASQVNFMAFEVLKTRVGRWLNEELNVKAKILCTFNPKKNWIDSTFYRPYSKGEESPDTKFVFALPTDNPHLPKEYIERLQNLKDKATKERLLHGNFDYDDDPTCLIDYESIEDIWLNDHVKSGSPYLTADIARYGSDKAVIFVWKGFKIVEIKVFEISSTVEIQNFINTMRAKHGITTSNCVADEDGVGGGVVDNCRIKGFVNNSKPNNAQYQNLKSECGYKLAELINKIHVDCDVSQQVKEDIEQELGQLKTFDADKDGKLRILPKEKIKENIGRSPDFLDVFIMRMYFEVKTKIFIV